jgi:hypothetical protein
VTELRSGARKFIYITIFVALASETLLIRPNQSTHSFGIIPVLLLLALVGVSWRFPIPFGRRRKLYFDTTFLLAAVLFLAPEIAIPVCAAGTVLGQVLCKRSGAEIAFNGAQSAFQALAASLAISTLGWSWSIGSTRLAELLPALLAAGTIAYVVNTLLVNAMIAFQSGDSILTIWSPAELRPGWSELASHLMQVLAAGAVYGVLREGHAGEALAALCAAGALAALQRALRKHIRTQAPAGH